MNTNPDIFQEINKFVERYRQATQDELKSVEDLADLLKTALSKFPYFIRELRRQYPEIPHIKLLKLEQLARGKLYAPLAVAQNFFYEKLRIYPVDEQKRLYTGTCHFFDGTKSVVRKVASLSCVEVRRVFFKDGARTIEQQREHLAAQKKTKKEVDYEVTKDGITVFRRCHVSREVLLESASKLFTRDEVLSLLVTLHKK